MYRYTCAHLVLLALSPSLAQAAPAVSHLLRRQSQSSGPSEAASIGPQVWIPLLVIGILFAVGVVVACGNRHFNWNWGTGAAQAAGATTGTTPAANAREVTADQLAGTNGNATNGANGGTNRARRPRRTRRTPSQISTHSLPAYMKEPGEQEIVIVRGPEDMEDMPIPITVTMPVVDEHTVETPEGSLDLSRTTTSVYVPMPNTSNDEPLLHNNEHDPHQHLSAAQDEFATRRSFDSVMSSEENSQVHYLGDAPPYEAIALNSTHDLPASAPASTPAGVPPTDPSPTQTSQNRTSTEQPGTGSTRRRSMFMSIFNPRNSRIASPPPPANAGTPEPRVSTHTREGSGPSIVSVAPSIVSVAPSEREPRPRSHIRHQPSHSGSGSMFSLLSRTRSNGNLGGADRLTSPSLISLHSISSPLSHTLVRTEFTYPKSGPTPEQLKLISSRDSFARFGVPYGPDAIAFASSSRVELEPPPGFEEVAGPSGAAESSSSPEEHDESRSPVADGAEPHSADTSSSSDPVHASTPEADSRPQAERADTDSPVPNVDQATSRTSALVETEAAAVPASPSPESERPSSPPGLLSPPSGAPVASPSASSAPPSAFKGSFNPGSLPARAASRASSYMSFATAEESLPTSEPPTPTVSRPDDDGYESNTETPVDKSAPTTPRMEPRHLHESTDTTITPGR